MTTIICLTSLNDLSTQKAVANHTRKLGADFHVECIDDIDKMYSLSVTNDGTIKYSFGTLHSMSREPTSIWHRHCEALRRSRFNNAVKRKFSDENSQRFFMSEYEYIVINLYGNLSQYYWVNSLASNIAAQGKIKNLTIAANLGLKTPPTLASNSTNEILEFSKKYHAELLIKPFNSFEIFDGNRLYHCVARKISLEQIVNNSKSLELAPVFLQKYIEKKFEIRTVVIGNIIFSIAIFSQEHEKAIEDWRCAPLHELRYAAHKLPAVIEESLIAFNKSFGLEFSVFDLVLGLDDEIYFLECNPDGEWYWLEMATGMEISKAMAENLVAGALAQRI